jgi:butyrate kinase
MTRILAINPGSTSTKVARFQDEDAVRTEDLRHADADLARFAGAPVLSQLDFRLDAIARAIDTHELDAVVGRGGLLEPLPGGTYRVDDVMLDDLRVARRGQHASNLGAFLADRIAREAGCAAFIVDPVSVDEWTPVARYSGLAGIERESLSHALNTKAVARRHAGETSTRYEDLRLVIVHLGSGCTVSAHMNGRMVDACNSMDEGPFAMDRAGGLPVSKLLALATTSSNLRRRVFGDGGVFSYLGTRDLPAVLARIDAGDALAAEVVTALLYQVAKEAGAMAAVLEGKVDAVLVTGGMAHAPRIAGALRTSLAWIGPVHVYPGEDELRALAEGASRVRDGAEPAQVYADCVLRRP